MCVDVDERVLRCINDNFGTVIKRTHESPTVFSISDWEIRSNRVKELLDIYADAKCVYTSRLHVALPCLAMGTPVVVIRKTFDDPDTKARFYPFINWVDHYKVDDFLERYDFTIKPNGIEYLPFRNKLIEETKKFIEDCEQGRIVNRFSGQSKRFYHGLTELAFNNKIPELIQQIEKLKKKVLNK